MGQEPILYLRPGDWRRLPARTGLRKALSKDRLLDFESETPRINLTNSDGLPDIWRGARFSHILGPPIFAVELDAPNENFCTGRINSYPLAE